jgi:hypothetical protein
MTALETGTELFDLFGQEGSCSICMEDLAEGERVRAVRSCQHLFHAACVEPWLLSHGTCPMCRSAAVAVQAAPAALSSTTEAIQSLLAAMSQLQPEQAPVSGVLTQIQTLLDQTRSALQTRRHLLTYCVGHGIFSRFATPALFNSVRAQLQADLSGFEFEGIRMFPLNTNSLTAFTASVRASYRELREVYAGSVIHNPEFAALEGRLHAARPVSQFLQNYWTTDAENYWTAVTTAAIS